MLFLVILAPLPLPAQRQIVSVPFRSVNSYMLVEASIDDTPVTLLVDTGANKTILGAINWQSATSGESAGESGSRHYWECPALASAR